MEDVSAYITGACSSVASVSVQWDTSAMEAYDAAVFAAVKVATELAVKQATSVIPGLVAVHFDAITLGEEAHASSLTYTLELKAKGPKNIDNQALYGVAVAALTLKTQLEAKGAIQIGEACILNSRSPYVKQWHAQGIKASVVVCSDSISQGLGEDKAGKEIMALLEEFEVSVANYQVIADDANLIASAVKQYASKSDLLIFTGGTGLAKRDITPETLIPLLERRIPGVEEAIRSYGQQRVPYAMLSRSVVGTLGGCLVMALPGSTKGARESMQAVFPHLLHVHKLLKGDTGH